MTSWPEEKVLKCVGSLHGWVFCREMTKGYVHLSQEVVPCQSVFIKYFKQESVIRWIYSKIKFFIPLWVQRLFNCFCLYQSKFPILIRYVQ